MIVQILVGAVLLGNNLVNCPQYEIAKPFYQIVEQDYQQKLREQAEKEIATTEDETTEQITEQGTAEKSTEQKTEIDNTTIEDDSDKNIEIPKEVSIDDVHFGDNGTYYGEISIPTIGVKTSVVLGATQGNVDSNDVCVSRQGGYCGSGKPVIIMGHNYNSLSSLPKIRKGAKIIITTTYGVYVYKVTDMSVGKINSDETNILNDKGNPLIQRDGKKEILQVYTCYGEKGGRFVVKAKKVKGTKIIESKVTEEPKTTEEKEKKKPEIIEE